MLALTVGLTLAGVGDPGIIRSALGIMMALTAIMALGRIEKRLVQVPRHQR